MKNDQVIIDGIDGQSETVQALLRDIDRKSQYETGYRVGRMEVLREWEKWLDSISANVSRDGDDETVSAMERDQEKYGCVPSALTIEQCESLLWHIASRKGMTVEWVGQWIDAVKPQ